jgi:hypothetical protein
MKSIQTLFLAAACGLAFTLTVSADEIKQGVATVVRVKGEASYTLESGANAKWIPLVAGKVLVAGATIRTEPYAMIDMVLGKQIEMPQARPVREWTTLPVSPAPDSLVRGTVDYRPSSEQNVVRLSGGTTLKIDKLTVSDTGVDTVSDTELDLQTGRIFASVKKLSQESKYFVKIPNGIAGVRGTQFGLGADGWCGVLKNSVWLSITDKNGNPVTVEIKEGNQFNPGNLGNPNGGLTPLPADVINLLHEIATALDTLRLQIVAFAHDNTYTLISPVNGHK